MPILDYLPDDRLITALANRLSFAPTIRLACQTQVSGSGKIALRRLALDREDLELIHHTDDQSRKIGCNRRRKANCHSVAFDRQVTLEDQVILESTDYDAPLTLSDEQHMPSDQPGIVMRKQLAALLKQHGEIEQRRMQCHNPC